MKQDFYDKKIVILDLNFLEIEQYTIDEQIYAKKLLRELTANQNVILATDNSIFQALGGIELLGLKSGYLISNAGTTVTNIANQKTISTAAIDPEIAAKICNLCVWNNIHFSLITDDAIFPFNLNYWLIKRYKSDLSYLYRHMEDALGLTPDILRVLERHPVRKIEIYFLHREYHKRQREIFRFVAPFEGEIDYSINVSTLQILPKGHTKLNSIRLIMETLELNADLSKDGIYAALDQYDPETARGNYFAIMDYELCDDLPREETEGRELLPVGAISWVR